MCLPMGEEAMQEARMKEEGGVLWKDGGWARCASLHLGPLGCLLYPGLDSNIADFPTPPLPRHPLLC